MLKNECNGEKGSYLGFSYHLVDNLQLKGSIQLILKKLLFQNVQQEAI